jgi:hypothetical protein
MQVNLAKTPIENILDLIKATAGNETAAASLTTAMFTAGAPAVRAPDADPSNTTLVLTAVNGQGIANGSTKTLTYTRLALDSKITPPGNVVVVAGDTEAQVKTKIAAAYGLVESELTFGTIVVPGEGATETVTVEVAATSLLYVDADGIIVTIENPAEPADFDSFVPQGQMDGFDPQS